MSRLPQPGQDSGQWGAILNDYLQQAHNADGTLKASAVGTSAVADGSITEVKLSSALATKINAAGGGGNTTVADGSITPAKLSSTNSPAASQLLSYDGTRFAWVNAPTGGGGTTSGENNTASNVGNAGVGVYKQKTGVNLEFKKVNAASNKVTVTDNTGASQVDLDVNEANLNIGNMTGTLAQSKVTNLATDLSAKLDKTTYTTKGDILVGTGAGTVTRVSSGADGLVLTSDAASAGGVKWAAAGSVAGGGGGLAFTAKHVTNNYTANNGEWVFIDLTAGPVTITAPAPVNGGAFTVKKVDASNNNVTVVVPSGNIDGYMVNWSFAATDRGISQDFISDGTNWYLD